MKRDNDLSPLRLCFSELMHGRRGLDRLAEGGGRLTGQLFEDDAESDVATETARLGNVRDQ